MATTKPNIEGWNGAKWIRRDKRLAHYLRTGGMCAYCGAACVAGGAHTLDHIVPRCKGGDNSDYNVVTCCQSCNEAKGGRTLGEWLRSRALSAKDAAEIRRNVNNARRRSIPAARRTAKALIDCAGSYSAAIAEYFAF